MWDGRTDQPNDGMTEGRQDGQRLLPYPPLPFSAVDKKGHNSAISAFKIAILDSMDCSLDKKYIL